MSETHLLLEQHLEAGRLDQAESIVNLLLSHDPEDLRAQVAQVRLEASLGEFDDAAVRLLDLVERYPEEPEPLAYLAIFMERDGEHERARRTAEKALELGAEVASLFTLMGQYVAADGFPDQAYLFFERALGLSEQQSGAWLGRARILRDRGELADAEEAYIQAVEHGPQRVEAWVELIDLEAGAGATDAAQENLALALRTHPGHPDLIAIQRQGQDTDGDPASQLLSTLRDALLGQDVNNAGNALVTLRESFPEEAQRYVGEAEYVIASEQGDPVPLVHILTRLSREKPNDWEIKTTLGRLMLRPSPLQNPRAAASHCEDAWRMSGEHPYAGLGLVEAWAATGKTAFASALCKRLAETEGPISLVARAILAGNED